MYVKGSSKIVGRIYARTKNLGSISAFVKLWNIFHRNKLTEDGWKSWNKAYKVKNSKTQRLFPRAMAWDLCNKKMRFRHGKRRRTKIATTGWNSRLNRTVKKHTCSVLAPGYFKVGWKTRNHENVCACLHTVLWVWKQSGASWNRAAMTRNIA